MICQATEIHGYTQPRRKYGDAGGILSGMFKHSSLMLILYQVTSRVVCTVFRKVVADNFVSKAPTVGGLALYLSSISYIDIRRLIASFLLLLAH